MASANDGLIDTFKEIVWDNLIKVALNALFTKIPWLNWGPFRWLVTYIVEKYTDELYVFFSTYINLKTIAFTNKEAEEIYDQDSVELYLIAKESGIDSQEYKDKREESKKSFQNVIQFGVARIS